MNISPYTNSLFKQPWWLDIVAEGRWKEAFIKDDKGNVIARIAYVVDGNKVYMPPKTQNLGIWFSPNLENDYVALKRIIYQLNDYLGKNKLINHALSPINKYVLPFRWLGYSFEVRFTYRISDLSNIDLVWNKFRKSTKRKIKYAEKRVNIRMGGSFENLWNLLQKTYEIQGRKYNVPRELTEKIFYITQNSGNGGIFGSL